MAEAKWHYTKQGEELGPVSSSQLKGLAASGELLPTDLVWKEGLSDWMPARKLRGLFPDAPSSDDPVSASPAVAESKDTGLESAKPIQATTTGTPRVEIGRWWSEAWTLVKPSWLEYVVALLAFGFIIFLAFCASPA